MKNKIWHSMYHWLLLFRASLKYNPVEVLFVILLVLYSIVGYGNFNRWHNDVFTYAPILFMSAHIINDWTKQGSYRIFYYLSVLLLVPVIIFSDTSWLCKPSWFVTLIILSLLYWQIGSRNRDVEFIHRFLRFCWAIILSLTLSVISYSLLLSIYGAINYLFEIDLFTDYNAYIGIIVWIGMFPMFFLVFDRDESFGNCGKVINILSRFILSPVLLIYSFLFYAYMGKIIFTLSLPEGGVCFMVTVFVVIAFLLKGIFMYISKSYYRWFYDYLPWIVMPTLALYAVGAFYRINQYGWTVMRVYLVIAGLVMLILCITSLLRRPGVYFHAAWSAVLLLSMLTYIPGISAKDIERISQNNRVGDSSENISAFESDYIMIDDSLTHDVSGYNHYRTLDVWDNALGDTICCGVGDSVWVSFEKKAFMREQYAKIGLELSEVLPDSLRSEILCYKNDTSMLIFNQVRLYWEKEKETEFLGAGSACYFWK